MQCPKCQHENRDAAKFCEECASPLAQHTCSNCGAELRPTSKFCDGCAQPVGLAAAHIPDRDARAYTPKHLADKILQSKSALEGERKQVTVLFADVKGSMELAEQVDPEEWHGILDRFFRILTDGIHRFEGTVNQYTGDGIMALFGAPISHEDHAQRACYSALQLRDALKDYAQQLKREHGLDLSVRMGMNSGDVVVGKIGDDLRMDYTAKGHTVGLAARMEQLAEQEKPYLSEATARLVDGYFDLEELGEFKIKGVSAPMAAYGLLRAGSLRTRFDISRSRGLTRFVGRNDEIEALHGALARARAGSGQVVGVVADAGTGKSRLCYEFTSWCRAEGIEVLEGHGLAHGKNIPFLPMLEIVRGYFGISDQDDARGVREKIAGRLLLLDEGFREALPLMFEFLGAPDPTRPVPRMDPEARQRQLFAIIREIVQSDNDDVGVTLIEDLHWVDRGTESYIEQYVDALPGSRNVLLLTFRPGYHAVWMQKSYYQQLPLAPLGPEGVRELLDDLLGSDSSLEGLADGIHARTAGNPFFTEEVVQSLIESGRLEGTRGTYRLVGRVDDVDVPASVQSILAARIDRLDEQAKAVLQTAAIIGKRFSEQIMEAVTELDESALTTSLARLQGGEFIYQESLYPVPEYAFKHPLTQEVAYASQLSDRRCQAHAAVARAIQAGRAADDDEHAALIAHHWEAAGEMLTAARWYRRAAEWTGRSDIAEALRHWQRVRVLLEREDGAPEVDEHAFEACVQILSLGWRAHMPTAEAAQVFEEGTTIAARSGDLANRAQLAASYAGWSASNTGDTGDYLAAASGALALAKRTGDADAHVAALINVTYSHQLAGDLAGTLRAAEEILRLTEHDATLGARYWGFNARHWARMEKAYPLIYMGRLAEAEHEMARATEDLKTHPDPETRGWVEAHFVHFAAATGRGYEQSLNHARASVEMADNVGSEFSRCLAFGTLSAACALNGRWADAVAAGEKAVSFETQVSTGRFEIPYMWNLLAEAHLGAGDLDAARLAAQRAITMAREMCTREYECRGQVTMAKILLAADGDEASTDIEYALDRATELVNDTGAELMRPVIEEQRARLAAVIGDKARYRDQLALAQRLFTEMNATGHAERIAKELGT